MLDTGERLIELCDLYPEDAYVEEGYFNVMDKGSKERLVPIGGLAQKMPRRFIIRFRPGDSIDANNHVFLTMDGKPLRPNAVEVLLKRWGKKAWVPRLHAQLWLCLSITADPRAYQS